MALTSTHDGQGNVILYGGTATHDNMGNVVLTVAATDGGTAIAEDEVSLSLVDTSGYAEHEEVAEAAKTATDYIDFDEGLIVGDLREDGKVGNNVFIDSDSVNIRNGKTVLAKFAAKLIELGKNATDAVINLCGGVGKIWAMEGQYQSQKRLNLSGGDTLGIYGPYAVDVRTNSNDFEDSTNATSEAYLALSSVLTFSQERVATAYLRAKWMESGIYEDAALSLYSKEGTAFAQLSAADNFVTVYDDRTEATHPMTNTYQGMAFNTTHAKASTRSGFSAERSDGGTKVFFGVGSDGINHGIYSDKSAGWVVHENGDGQVFANGNVHIGQSVVSNCALASGFALYGSEAVTARKYGKVVTVTGTLKNTAAKTYDTSPVDMFTVPSGYRPSNTVYAVCQGSNFHKWVLTINTAGEAKIQRYGTASASVQAAAGSWLPFTVTYVQE